MRRFFIENKELFLCISKDEYLHKNAFKKNFNRDAELLKHTDEYNIYKTSINSVEDAQNIIKKTPTLILRVFEGLKGA